MPRHQQVVRQWRLLRQLEGSSQGINVAELARTQEFGSERSIYRDLEALEQAGFPLYNEVVDGQSRRRLTETYRKKGGVPLELSELMALRCARSAIESLEGTPFFEALHDLIRKLDDQLTPTQRIFAKQMDEAIVGDPFGRPHYEDLKPAMETLQQAITEQRTIELSHHSPKGAITQRRVDPYNLWVHRGVLYLIGWCHLRQAIRTFSLARLRKVTLTREPFTPQADYDFTAFAKERFRIMSEGKIQPVRIRFAPEAALYISERTWHPSQTITAEKDGAITLSMEVDGLAELTTWICSFGPRARALEPDELVQRVKAELGGALAGYGGDAARRGRSEDRRAGGRGRSAGGGEKSDGGKKSEGDEKK